MGDNRVVQFMKLSPKEEVDRGELFGWYGEPVNFCQTANEKSFLVMPISCSTLINTGCQLREQVERKSEKHMKALLWGWKSIHEKPPVLPLGLEHHLRKSLL